MFNMVLNTPLPHTNFINSCSQVFYRLCPGNFQNFAWTHPIPSQWVTDLQSEAPWLNNWTLALMLKGSFKKNLPNVFVNVFWGIFPLPTNIFCSKSIKKHLRKVWNMIKVNNKSTRPTSFKNLWFSDFFRGYRMTLLWCFYC